MNSDERDRSGRDPDAGHSEPKGEPRGAAVSDAGKSLASAFTAFGLRAEAEPIRKGLHVVATPIGNLSDISFRALATLAAAAAVIAEDTRVTKTLLAHYGIATPLVAYHEHNAAVMRPHLLARLASGAALALVSDAGTPLVSDPGYKLVSDALAQNIEVFSVPGASAVLAALVVAGLPTDRFFFEGFLPPKSGARRQRIAELASIPGTLVFFESPRRVAETLADLAAVLGRRDAALARELTKYYETVRRAPLPDLAAALAGRGAAERRDRGAGRTAWGGGRDRQPGRNRREALEGAGDPFGQGCRRDRVRRDRPAAPKNLRARHRTDGLVRCAGVRRAQRG